MSLDLLLILASVISLTVGQETPSPVVTIKKGSLKGKFVSTRDKRSVAGFFGIPFAKPPVGDLRFQPPQPIEPWTDIRLAVRQPPACMQPLHPRVSEDCLYLNVYTPNTSTRPLLPVLVYIYGGAFEIGSADAYTHEYLMDEDIVYVTIQYRLGLFGFFSTGDKSVPGNMGFKDQRAGLRWVRDNIASFGGDPDRVTIFGESAGAVSVHYLMTFCAQEGLFRAGISHSGSALVPWGFKPPVEVRKMVAELAKLSRCPSDSLGLVTCLRDKSADNIVRLYTLDYKTQMYVGMEKFASGILPLVGGVLEPACVEDRLVTGVPWKFNTTLPWLLGVNSKEVLFVFSSALEDKTNRGYHRLDSMFDHFLPLTMNFQNSMVDDDNIAVDFRDFYLQGQNITKDTLRNFINGVSDALFMYGSYESAVRSRRGNTYMYYFEYIVAHSLFPVPAGSRIGAAHGDELFSFFPHPANPKPNQNPTTLEDEKLSRKMIKIWMNFVKYLNPTPDDSLGIQWEPFQTNKSYLHITQNDFKMESPFFEERMSFWENKPQPFRDDVYSDPDC